MSVSDEKLVIEGGRLKVLCQRRQLEAKAQNGVVVDYFRFTVKRQNLPLETSADHGAIVLKTVPKDTDDQSLARWFAHVFAQLLGYTVGMDRPGRDYYEFTTTIDNAFGHEVASVSAGGESQRGTICFTLKGEGCTMARPGWEKRVHDYFGPMLPTITRIDLAKDFFEGETNVEECVGLYKAHEFSYRNRKPKYTTHGCWDIGALDEDGMPIRGHSRTFQVGKRDSGKLFRGYEKGHQFALMDSKWFRAEVELRNVNRVIPWDALTFGAEYFAGSYPAMQLLCNRETATKITTATKVGEASAQRVVNWVKRVVAPTLVQISSVMENDDWLVGLVVDQHHRRVPRRLRGLDHHTMASGIKAALAPFTNFTNPCAPAALGL